MNCKSLSCNYICVALTYCFAFFSVFVCVAAHAEQGKASAEKRDASAAINVAKNAAKTISELPVATATGIPLDSTWKKLEYKYATENVVHPAWGLAHAERDYRNALLLAERENMHVDKDVLFAAAYLHDLGGIGSFQKEHVDHAVRSVELAEPLLREWGFPMDKWAGVRETILGHVYYASAPPTMTEAIVFHDADCLDFLGDIGIARLYAASSELSKEGNLMGATKAIESMQKQIPGKLITPSAKADAVMRNAETDDFLKKVARYNFNLSAF